MSDKQFFDRISPYQFASFMPENNRENTVANAPSKAIAPGPWSPRYTMEQSAQTTRPNSSVLVQQAPYYMQSLNLSGRGNQALSQAQSQPQPQPQPQPHLQASTRSSQLQATSHHILPSIQPPRSSQSRASCPRVYDSLSTPSKAMASHSVPKSPGSDKAMAPIGTVSMDSGSVGSGGTAGTIGTIGSIGSLENDLEPRNDIIADLKLQIEALATALTLTDNASADKLQSCDGMEMAHRILSKLKNLRSENTRLMKLASGTYAAELEAELSSLKMENETLKRQLSSQISKE